MKKDRFKKVKRRNKQSYFLSWSLLNRCSHTHSCILFQSFAISSVCVSLHGKYWRVRDSSAALIAFLTTLIERIVHWMSCCSQKSCTSWAKQATQKDKNKRRETSLGSLLLLSPCNVNWKPSVKYCLSCRCQCLCLRVWEKRIIPSKTHIFYDDANGKGRFFPLPAFVVNSSEVAMIC